MLYIYIYIAESILKHIDQYQVKTVVKQMVTQKKIEIGLDFVDF